MIFPQYSWGELRKFSLYSISLSSPEKMQGGNMSQSYAHMQVKEELDDMLHWSKWKTSLSPLTPEDP